MTEVLYRSERVHRYTVDETWGDPPVWVTDMVGQPEAFVVDTYRGKATQWEVEKDGEIVYGFGGYYAGISTRALENLALEPK